MSLAPIALSPDIKHLRDEGYEVEVKNNYLLVHGVPYVNAQRQVLRGIAVTDLNVNAGVLDAPRDHQIWFQGEFPCRQSGTPIEAIRHTDAAQALWAEFQVQHRFSNKPEGSYPDYYSKMTGYIRILEHEARAIDPTATAQTFRPIPAAEEASVFVYEDSASSRADILAVTEKLSTGKVAIVGLGGTGSYVLDLVAKTPATEVHLFDGDLFLQHNAFRSPGAASIETIGNRLMKVDYYLEVYRAMRRGIIPHALYVTEENLDQLDGFDFVFICVDRGPVRKLIGEHLQGLGIPFVDVGMELLMVSGMECLVGTCRATMSTPTKLDAFQRHAPFFEDVTEDLYRKNIQVADMNALNAALAVQKWKQYCGFYHDAFQAHHLTYSVNAQSLTRDETGLKATG